jgi:hypothetical protein
MPIGLETNLIDEAIVDYSILDAQAEDVPAFDEEGNYNKTIWQRGDIITQDKLNKIEDALYEINAADSNFITNEELESELANKADAGHKHPASYITGLARVATSGSYNDLSNKPAIPNTSNLATKTELAGKADYYHDHDGVYAPTSHTHTAYAANNHTHEGYLTEVPATYATKKYVSDFVNDSGFITSIPSSYITETELENELGGRGYASEDFVIRKISEAQFSSGDGSGLILDNYATIAQLNTKADMAHNHDGRYLTEIPTTYATKTYVDNAIDSIEIPDANIDPSILSNYPTLDVMNEALASKADNGHTHDGYSIIGHTHEDYALKSEIPDMVEVPNNIGAFTNDVGYITDEAIAPINEAIDGINNSINDLDQNLNNYALKTQIPTVPTNVSTFTNDAKYMSSNTVTRIEIVDELPETEEPGVLYIVKE